MFGELVGTNGFKRPQVRFGGTQNNITFISSELGYFRCQAEVLINTSSNTHSQSINGGCSTSQRYNYNEPIVDLSSDADFNIEALVENASDSIIVKYLEVFIDGL
jgi:hypothetical protein